MDGRTMVSPDHWRCDCDGCCAIGPFLDSLSRPIPPSDLIYPPLDSHLYRMSWQCTLSDLWSQKRTSQSLGLNSIIWRLAGKEPIRRTLGEIMNTKQNCWIGYQDLGGDEYRNPSPPLPSYKLRRDFVGLRFEIFSPENVTSPLLAHTHLLRQIPPRGGAITPSPLPHQPFGRPRPSPPPQPYQQRRKGAFSAKFFLDFLLKMTNETSPLGFLPIPP